MAPVSGKSGVIHTMVVPTTSAKHSCAANEASSSPKSQSPGNLTVTVAVNGKNFILDATAGPASNRKPVCKRLKQGLEASQYSASLPDIP